VRDRGEKTERRNDERHTGDGWKETAGNIERGTDREEETDR
jgi:hypothetical protein